jgi:hypothetical protein
MTSPPCSPCPLAFELQAGTRSPSDRPASGWGPAAAPPPLGAVETQDVTGSYNSCASGLWAATCRASRELAASAPVQSVHRYVAGRCWFPPSPIKGGWGALEVSTAASVGAMCAGRRASGCSKCASPPPSRGGIALTFYGGCEVRHKV